MRHEQESATAEREREILVILGGWGAIPSVEGLAKCIAAYCASRERAAEEATRHEFLALCDRHPHKLADVLAGLVRMTPPYDSGAFARAVQQAVEAERERCATVEKLKDAAYRERDQLVCALSKLYPAGLERHPDSDTTWDNDWRWIVFIELPSGQATWHIHDSELDMFDHLSRFKGYVWDGHSTLEKYARLSALPATVSPRTVESNSHTYHHSPATSTPAGLPASDTVPCLRFALSWMREHGRGAAVFAASEDAREELESIERAQEREGKLRAALVRVKNMAHRAWEDPASVKEMFKGIEAEAIAALRSK